MGGRVGERAGTALKCVLPRISKQGLKGVFTGCSSRHTYAIRMRMIPLLLGACLAVVAPALPSGAQSRRHDEQEDLRQKRQQGKLLALREIEARVVPQMGGAEYLGFDFDAETTIYTLKFVRNGQVIWVDVDGRSGQIVRRTGR